MEPQAVVAAVIHRDGLIFVARRSGGVHAGKWEFPGGKVEPGESPEAALRREIDEEFGVTVAVGELLLRVPFAVAGTEFVLLAHSARHLAGEYRPVAHGAIDWVAPERLAILDLAPADKPVAAEVIRRSEATGRGSGGAMPF